MLIAHAAGYIGKTAETRATQGGDTVTSWSVGVNTGKDKTTWLDCAIWGERGEKLAPHLTKGKFVAVTGFPSARAWVDKDGNARAELGMSVNTVTFGSKSEGGGETRKPSGGPDDLDDEIPF
jgi:single-strand DNA-binding protein